jgi:chemotaxis regulatin CheY-phosphate phosphatase CheZ
MTILGDLLDKLSAAADKISDAQDRIDNVVKSKETVALARTELEKLKDNAPGMKDARAAIVKAFAARAGKGAVTTPTMDISSESIVGKL